ncbi:MAG: NADH-ubiquinone oxidoreductase-F iron-sulfur binding region domain-containing protein, partial [Rhodospirillales bacterium]|nr:NADH-ubiquinone oxidoreductase-F iron-sulfur binding region domain-containing protein [Rhodospirillales bacterium]
REIFFYLRDEYAHIRELLIREISEMQEAGLLENFHLDLRRGAGAYVCGEESALLESLEGKRGLPRNRPPYPAESGLFGRPTIINNVETMFWVRGIINDGAQKYLDQGRPRFYSVSGPVKKPGVIRAPAGTTARQLIDEHCGGMTSGHELKAFLPGGASGGILPSSMADLPLDFGSLDEHGCFVGSAALIVLSDQQDLHSAIRNLISFFADESCGQCTPCRAGCEKMLELTRQPVWDEALIKDLSEVMRDASICGLGQAAPNGVETALNFFGGELI